MRRARKHLTYANLVATLALALALGGGVAYAANHLAKNSVGPKQLQRNAVTGAKVKNGSLTGADIKASTLATVPNAAAAAQAVNADQLGGATPSSYRDHCPSGTAAVTAVLCASPGLGEKDWTTAAEACAARGLELPSPSQGLILAARTKADEFWTDDFWINGANAVALHVFEAKLFGLLTSLTTGTICVSAPSN